MNPAWVTRLFILLGFATNEVKRVQHVAEQFRQEYPDAPEDFIQRAARRSVYQEDFVDCVPETGTEFIEAVVLGILGVVLTIAILAGLGLGVLILIAKLSS